MTRRVRSVILYVLVFLFFVLGTGAVFYAQGWRAKLAPLTFDKVGAIYLRTFPDTASVRVDGLEKKRDPSIFERGVLLGNMFPGRHEVKVDAEGYQEWKATLEVAPSKVTAHARLVLVPDTGSIATTTPIRNFQVIGENTFVSTTSGLVTLGGRPLRGQTVSAITDNGRKVVSYGAGSFFWTDYDTAASGSMTRAFPNLIISPKAAASTAFEAVPQSNLFVISEPRSVRLLNSETGVITALTPTSAFVAATAASQTRVAWSEFNAQKKVSRISFRDLPSSATFEEVDTVPGRTKRMIFFDRATLLLLQDDGALYSLSLPGATRDRIASGVRHFEATDDRSRLAILDSDGLTVISGRDGEAYLFLAMENVESISKIGWYKDNLHLFVVRDGTTLFLDIADPSLGVEHKVAETKNFAYLPGANDLYFLQNDKLIRVEFPD